MTWWSRLPVTLVFVLPVSVPSLVDKSVTT
jgi:hypothetical protein